MAKKIINAKTIIAFIVLSGIISLYNAIALSNTTKHYITYTGIELITINNTPTVRMIGNAEGLNINDNKDLLLFKFNNISDDMVSGERYEITTVRLPFGENVIINFKNLK